MISRVCALWQEPTVGTSVGTFLPYNVKERNGSLLFLVVMESLLCFWMDHKNELAYCISTLEI